MGSCSASTTGGRRRFTVDEYYKLAEVGILAPDERVELLAGEIILMAPIGIKHAYGVTQFSEEFSVRLGRRVTVRVQNPIRLSEGEEPEPDVAILHRTDDGYASRHPEPEDIILLIEIADSSVGFDRRHKLPMYALHGIRKSGWATSTPGGWKFTTNPWLQDTDVFACSTPERCVARGVSRP